MPEIKSNDREQAVTLADQLCDVAGLYEARGTDRDVQRLINHILHPYSDRRDGWITTKFNELLQGKHTESECDFRRQLGEVAGLLGQMYCDGRPGTKKPPTNAAERLRRMAEYLDKTYGDTVTSGDQATTKRPDRALSDPIPISWLRSVTPQKTVKGASDKLRIWLERREVKTAKLAGKWHADKADLLMAFARNPTVKAHIQEYSGE